VRLAGGVVAVACILLGTAAAEPLALTVEKIDSFVLAGADEANGPLEFIGGLVVTSNSADFGGLSGIDILEDGTAFLVGDSGTFIRARLVHENGRLAGLADAEIGSLFPDREASKAVGDAEDIAFDPKDRRRGVIVRERQANAMLSFELERSRPANFEPRRVGAPDSLLRSNGGLESVAYAPATSPIAGEIIAIAERPPRGETDIPGWVAGKGMFSVVRRDGFDVSSARFLPNGDLLLLERRYIPGWDIAARIRRIDGATVKVGARLDGDYILDAGMGSQIDNLEGLAVGTDESGRSILTLVSDDNYNFLQRTLVLQFALARED
jgi:hypothetical protein